MIPPVVEPAWLSAHPDAVLADVRWYPDGRSPRDAYDAGHLPGAVLVDLDAVLAGEPTDQAGRHPLPEPDVFAAAMGALGIGDDDTVVAYDDAGGTVAARLVWMLRATGHDAALLDGGLTAREGPTSTEPARRSPGTFTPRAWPADRLADVEDAARAGRRAGGAAGDPALGSGRSTGESAAVLLDARPAGRYRGDGGTDPLDPRAGHVPGAVSVPARENVDADGRLLPVAVLRERLAAAGVVPGADVVSSCGSGVTACHTLLVVEHVGLGRGRLFPGSFSAWSRDRARPVATGEHPGGPGAEQGARWPT